METKTATTFNPCDDCPKAGNTCPVCTLENAVAAGFENRARISQLEAQLADEKAACWSQTAKLEAQLREREAECAGVRDMLGLLSMASPARVLDEIRDIGDALRNENARAESAEAALAAAREELAAEKRLHAKALASNKQLRQELAALKSRSEGSVEELPADLVARIERQILRFELEHDVKLTFGEVVRTLLDVALTGEEERDDE